jgi:hypothetical protein
VAATFAAHFAGVDSQVFAPKQEKRNVLLGSSSEPVESGRSVQ